MRALVALFFVLVPTAAFAHTGVGDPSGLVHGFVHPLGGLDHLLCMVAVGVLAAVLGGRALLLVPLSFVVMMTLGFLLGAGGAALPLVELGIGFSAVAIGAVAASGRPLPVGVAMTLAGAFAIFHGHAHGAEMPASTDALAYALGFIGATALLHLAGIASTLVVAALAGRHGRTLARAAGGVFALGGIGVLAGWL